MGCESELARFVCGTEFDDLPESVVRATKRNILDTIGVGLAGLNAPGIAQVFSYMTEMGGAPASTLLVTGEKAPPALAALANGSICHARDFDDNHDLAVIHTGPVTTPAALAVAEYIGGVSGKELINAIALGIDIHCRLGIATGPYVGWCYPALYGYFAAATVGAKLLKLDEEDVINAWGIAYSQAAGNLGMIPEGGLNKRLQLGFAASGGVMSALLARRGVTGSRESFEGKTGIFNLYHGGDYKPEALTRDLGRKYEVVDLSYKPYPCCRDHQGSIDAALKIRRDHALKHETIDEISAGVGPMAFRITCQPIDVKKRPRNVVDAQFSLPYVVACAFVKGKVDLNDFTDDAIKDREVLGLAAKVAPYIDSELEKRSRDEVAASRMSVRTSNGESYQAEVPLAKGHPRNPMSDEEFRAKFRGCASFGITGVSLAKLNRLIETVEHLERLGDVSELAGQFGLLETAA